MKYIYIFIYIASILLPLAAYADLPCAGFTPENKNSLEKTLDEISGLAASRTNPGYYWAHVDSGGPHALYLIDRHGKLLHSYTIEGANNVDWEDIAVGPCQDDHLLSCIYIADLGDNRFSRQDKSIIILREPQVLDNAKLSVLAKQRIVYPKVPQTFATSFIPQSLDRFINPDSESLMVHSQTAEMYIVSKQSFGGPQTLYRIPYAPDRAVSLIPLASYSFRSGMGNLTPLYNAVTGADFAPDGTRFVVRTYAAVYEFDVGLWKTPAAAFIHPVESFLSEEIQGEAVAYDGDGRSLITAGERRFTPASLSHFACMSKEH